MSSYTISSTACPTQCYTKIKICVKQHLVSSTLEYLRKTAEAHPSSEFRNCIFIDYLHCNWLYFQTLMKSVKHTAYCHGNSNRAMGMLIYTLILPSLIVQFHSLKNNSYPFERNNEARLPLLLHRLPNIRNNSRRDFLLVLHISRTDGWTLNNDFFLELGFQYNGCCGQNLELRTSIGIFTANAATMIPKLIIGM